MDDYQGEDAALAADPIIYAMASEVRTLTSAERDSWNFMRAASDEYNRRGGRNDRTIGGPARAIAAILDAPASLRAA